MPKQHKYREDVPEQAIIYTGYSRVCELLIFQPDDPGKGDVYIRAIGTKFWTRLNCYTQGRSEPQFAHPQILVEAPITEVNISDVQYGRELYRCYDNVPAPKRIRYLGP